MISNSSTLTALVVCFIVLSTAWNISCPYLVRALDAVYASMMFGFRAVVTWFMGLIIYYALSGESPYGESWTRWSPLILAGLIVLVVGALVYSKALQGIALWQKVFGDNEACVNHASVAKVQSGRNERQGSSELIAGDVEKNTV